MGVNLRLHLIKLTHNNLQDSITTANLYPYQTKAVETIVNELNNVEATRNLLFQLPTGGGKTVIFSEIANQYIRNTGKKVLILTHRVELLSQTAKVLNGFDIATKVIDSNVKELNDQDNYQCFVAMIETLNNRLMENNNFIRDISLVIVDEAHYNSFRKIFQYFRDINILGVTATPLSSNKQLPLSDNYDKLIVGESIADLIKNKYLCQATTYSYNVNLKTLTVGISGDYTVSSSERVYGQRHMLDILLRAYEEKCVGKKTLIFNAGIATSIKVYEHFTACGYENIRHLDSTFNRTERSEVLRWFRNTEGAILSSVGILTTGFDEPSVESIVLNRATRSLTLYHQMVGRGSRILKNKDHFSIVDLGNNAMRLGLWQDYINWDDVFKNPLKYIDNQAEKDPTEIVYQMPDDIRDRFTINNDEIFDVKEVYKHCIKTNVKPQHVIDDSIENHFQLILDSTIELSEAKELAKLLDDEIRHRLAVYTKCINGTENYKNWLYDKYVATLLQRLTFSLKHDEED